MQKKKRELVSDSVSVSHNKSVPCVRVVLCDRLAVLSEQTDTAAVFNSQL